MSKHVITNFSDFVNEAKKEKAEPKYMKLEDDFFNKASTDIKKAYFPDVIHGKDENKDYYAFKYAMECFSNGVLTYDKLLTKLSKNCKDTKENIHNILKKHVVDFGDFEFKA
jgi:hypothetical protein